MPSSNTVTLNSSQIKSVNYVNNSLVVTEGQKSSPPPTISQTGSQWNITIDVDRKNSAQVASAFNESTGGRYNEYAPDGGSGGTPNELNFFFAVDVTFQVNSSQQVQTRLYLAQGHYSTTNNWWIGGNAILNAGTPTLLLLSGSTVLQRQKMGGSTHDFTFAAY